MMGAVVALHTAAAPSKPRVRMLRGAGGTAKSRLTQTQLAERVGVDRPTVRRWETGEVAIPDEAAAVLADLFGVSVPFLLGQEGERRELTEDERAVERAVLSDVADALGDAVGRLPHSSDWRWAFLASRRTILNVLGDGGEPLGVA